MHLWDMNNKQNDYGRNIRKKANNSLLSDDGDNEDHGSIDKGPEDMGNSSIDEEYDERE